jgi:hypothetical protein
MKFVEINHPKLKDLANDLKWKIDQIIYVALEQLVILKLGGKLNLWVASRAVLSSMRRSAPQPTIRQDGLAYLFLEIAILDPIISTQFRLHNIVEAVAQLVKCQRIDSFP